MVHPLESPTLCTVPPTATPKRARRIIKEVKKVLLLIKVMIDVLVLLFFFWNKRIKRCEGQQV
ncbi:hypothetical protein YC2023_046769 [Brassica napus]